MPNTKVAAASALVEDDVFSFDPDGRRFDAVSATTTEGITVLVTTEGAVTVSEDTKVYVETDDETGEDETTVEDTVAEHVVQTVEEGPDADAEEGTDEDTRPRKRPGKRK